MFFCKQVIHAQIGGDITACQSTVYTYTNVAQTGYNYLWTVAPASSFITAQNNANANITYGGFGTYTITCTGTNGTNTNTNSLVVIVDQTPNPIITQLGQVQCQTMQTEQWGTQNLVVPDGTCIRACENSEVTYQVSSTTSTSNAFAWNVVGGTISSTTANTCTVQWGSTAAANSMTTGASISVTETTLNGCNGTNQLCVELILSPGQYNISTNITPYQGFAYTVCIGEVITFIPIPTFNNEVYTYNWDFGDGTFSNMENPSHAYAINNTYNGSITLTNQCGCSSTMPFVIVVNQGTPVEILCNSVTCINKIETYSTNLACANTIWSCIGGTILGTTNSTITAASVTILWDNPNGNPIEMGYGTVTADLSNCNNNACNTQVSTLLPVFGATNTNVGAGACVGQPILYDLPQWPATDFTFAISANFQNTANATIISPNFNSNEVWISAANEGNFQVEFTAVNTLTGCTFQGEFSPKSVFEAPVLIGQTVYCEGSDINLQIANVTAIMNVMVGIIDENGMPFGLQTSLWTSAIGELIIPSIMYPPNGNFTIMVNTHPFIADHCYGSIEISILPQPSSLGPIFGHTQVCSGANETYTLNNTDQGTHIEWLQMDGMNQYTAVGNSFTTNFIDQGAKTISAWRVTDAMPHCSTLVQMLTIDFVNPTISITPNPANACEDNTSTFTAICNTILDTYLWTLSNTSQASIISGQATANVNVQINHISPNTPQPMFLTCDITRCGQIFSSIVPLIILTAPVLTLDATPIPICSGTTANLEVLGINSAYTINSIIWDFGDGSGTQTTTTPTITNVYNNNTNANAIYTPTAIVNCSVNGIPCSFDVLVSNSITVYPYPDVNLASSNGNLNYIDCDLNMPTNCVTLTLTAPTASSIIWVNSLNSTTINGGYTLQVCQASPWTNVTYNALITDVNGCEALSPAFGFNYQCINGNGGTNCVEASPPFVDIFPAALQACGNGTAIFHAVNTFTSSGQNVVTSTWELVNPTGLISGNAVNTLPTLQPVSPNYIFNIPGQYTVLYKVNYDCTTSGNNIVWDEQVIDIPFLTEFYMELQCNATNDGYDLALFDHSAYINGSNAGVNYLWKINGVPTAQTQNYVIPNVTVGSTYTIELILVNATNTYNCEQVQTLATPPSLPIAAFTINPTLDPTSTAANPSTCEGQAITFTNNSTGAAPVSATWDFGDLTSSLIWQPGKAYDYSSLGFNTIPHIILTISDAYGCIASSSQSIAVQDENFNLTASPMYTNTNVCSPAASITALGMTFFSNFNTPLQYTWYTDNTQISAASTSPTYNNIYSSGAYWVQLSDAHGCTKNVNPDVQNVVVQNPPPVIITGASQACAGYDNPVILNGANGVPATALPPATITYDWLLNGLPIGNGGSTLELVALATGTYSITLSITYNQGTNGALTCSSNNYNNPFVFTVYGLPVPPTITGPMLINCANYQLEMNAIHPDPGTFTWSNGMQGSPINIYNGGALRCWFTDANGCGSQADVEIEQAPSTHFWRFPQNACYTFCSRMPILPFINSPLQSQNAPNTPNFGVNFANWDWQVNGATVTPNGGNNGSGVGMVEALIIDESPQNNGTAGGAGAYTWTLENSLCAQTTDPMQIEFEPCCALGLHDATITCINVQLQIYQITVQGNNGNGCMPDNYTNITMYDANTNLPTGLIVANFSPVIGNGQFMMTANVQISDVNVTDIQFCIEVVDGCSLGITCRECINIPVQGCPAVPRTANSNSTRITAVQDLEMYKAALPNKLKANKNRGLSSMQLYPNPATDNCNVQYSFANATAAHSLQVYDAIGKLVQSIVLDKPEGIHQLQIHNLPAGAYMVQLREANTAIATQRLLINKQN
jgi:hypothetical protein